MKNVAVEEQMSYKRLYLFMGMLGIILPLLVIWKCGAVPPSISDSYYLGGIVPFVLILGSIGILLFCNSGFGLADRICNVVCGVSATGVISFPCHSGKLLLCLAYPVIHYACAVTLFVTFAVMCLFVFTAIRSAKGYTPNKRRRNITYRVCGIAIILGLFVALKWTFWGEVVMLEAYGVAYLIQGKAFLRD